MSMGGGGGSKTQVVTQNTAPWPNQQPYLDLGFKAASNAFAAASDPNNPVDGKYFSGLTYTPMNQQTGEGVTSLIQRGQNGGTTNGQAAERALGAAATGLNQGGGTVLQGYNTLADTANGSFLNSSNPYFSTMVQNAFNAVRPSLESPFAASGRLGSGAYGKAISDSALNIAGNMASQNYSNERQNQLTAAGQLGQSDLGARQLGGQLTQSATGNDYQNIQSILQGGGILENYSDKALTDNINRFNFNANKTKSDAADFMSMIQGNYGGSSTTTTPLYGNQGLSSLFGGASAAGGLLGGLGSLFGGGGGSK